MKRTEDHEPEWDGDKANHPTIHCNRFEPAKGPPMTEPSREPSFDELKSIPEDLVREAYAVDADNKPWMRRVLWLGILEGERRAKSAAGADLGSEMQRLHDDHEINVEVDSFWDSQWRVRLGDSTNGFRESWLCESAEDAARALRTYRETLEAAP